MPAFVPDMPHPIPLLPHQGLWPGAPYGGGTSTAAAAATVGLGSPASSCQRLGFGAAGAATLRALSALWDCPKKLINTFASNNMGSSTASAVPPAETSGMAHQPPVPWALEGQATDAMTGGTLTAAALGPAAGSSRGPLAAHPKPAAAVAGIAAAGSEDVALAAGVQPDGGGGGAAAGAPGNNAAAAGAAGAGSNNPRRQNQRGECRKHGLMVLAKAPAVGHHKDCWRATGNHTFKQGAEAGKKAVSFKG